MDWEGGSGVLDPSPKSKRKIIVLYENQFNYDLGVISLYQNVRE